MKLEIQCVCDSLRLPDLGLTLAKGDVVVLDEVQAGKSRDLSRAVRAGGVRTRIIKGPVVVKKARPRRDSSRIRPAGSKKTIRRPTPEEIFQKRMEALLGQQGMVFEALLAGVQSDIAANLQSTFTASLEESLDAYKEAQQEASQAPAQEIDVDLIRKVVAEAVKNAVPAGVAVGAGSSAGSSAGSDDAPMFIPEGIVVDTNADIGTSEGSSGFSVD